MSVEDSPKSQRLLIDAVSKQNGQDSKTIRVLGKAESRRSYSASFTGNIQDDDPHPDD